MSETTARTIDEEARRRFEAAWHEGCPGPIDQYLPPPDHPAFLATLEELVLIELEFAWKARRAKGSATEPARIESYLLRYPRLADASILLRLVQQEYRLRRQAGDVRWPSIAAQALDDAPARTQGMSVPRMENALDFPGSSTQTQAVTSMISRHQNATGEDGLTTRRIPAL